MITDIQKYLVEFVGTFIFVSTILLSGNAWLIGLSLAILIFLFDWVSGGAFNPAVALILFRKKHINMVQMFGYIVFEVLGAICAYELWNKQ
tara:strand:- start:449 stop:721 length:273 start_codon:yes stop_codon:yes gene_type:complete